MDRLEQAIKYAEAGISVFPCKQTTKAPHTRKGFEDATRDTAKIKKWWTKYPDALIGGVCDTFTVLDIDDYNLTHTARIVVDQVIDDLRQRGVIHDSMFSVKTRSGGTHYYFDHETSGRMVKYLPCIDLLGNTGYIILPDQVDYVCNTHDAPWDHMDDFPDLNMEGLAASHEKYAYVVKEITDTVKEYRRSIGASKAPKTTAPTKTPVKKPASKETDTEFVITPGIYTEATDIEKVDPTLQLLDSEGKLHVDEGMLDTAMINTLFYNREIQIKLAEFMRLVVPSNLDERTKMRSPLPGHADHNPSFGLRWHDDRTHLLCRDFSNFFADQYKQIDYNLVRLYAVLKYGVNVPRLSKAEFVTWFLRMMHDSGIMNVDHLRQPFYDTEFKGYTAKQLHVIKQFQLLDALKRTYKGYSGITAMARNFGAAWCDVNHQTFASVMIKARQNGIAVWVDDHPNSYGMRPTRLYRVGVEVPADNYDYQTPEVTMKLNETINSEKRSPFKTDHQKEQEKREKEMTNKYGKDVSTFVGLKVGAGMHEKLTAFLEDFGVDNIASPDTMVLPLMIKDGYTEVNLERDQVDNTWYVPSNAIRLFVEEGEFDNHMLVAEFMSQELADLREVYFSNYDNDRVLDFEDEMEIFDLVLSPDIDPADIDDAMLNRMSLALSTYLPNISFSKQVLGYMGENELNQVLNGLDPSEDKEL